MSTSNLMEPGLVSGGKKVQSSSRQSLWRSERVGGLAGWGAGGGGGGWSDIVVSPVTVADKELDTEFADFAMIFCILLLNCRLPCPASRSEIKFCFMTCSGAGPRPRTPSVGGCVVSVLLLLGGEMIHL